MQQKGGVGEKRKYVGRKRMLRNKILLGIADVPLVTVQYEELRKSNQGCEEEE